MGEMPGPVDVLAADFRFAGYRETASRRNEEVQNGGQHVEAHDGLSEANRQRAVRLLRGGSLGTVARSE